MDTTFLLSIFNPDGFDLMLGLREWYKTCFKSLGWWQLLDQVVIMTFTWVNMGNFFTQAKVS